MKFKKSLGQHFLRDKRFVRKILKNLHFDGETVLEIGAGSGVMTRRIINRKVKRLYCLEKDLSLIPILKERFLSERVEIINEDILGFNIGSLGDNIVVFGNIPFNISNRLIRYLIDNRRFVKKAYLTFQKEFAHRLAASCNTRVYGYLSCFVQYYAKIRILFDIPKEAFYPKPKVDASFVEMDFCGYPLFRVGDEKLFFKLIRKAFSSRRKKVINSLSGLKDKENLKKAFSSLKLDTSSRAENLSLKDYYNLYLKAFT